MAFFRKYKKEWGRGQDAVSDKAAGKVVQVFSKIQNGFAFVMNKTCERMHPEKLKVVLVLFCVLSGGFSSYLFVSAIITPLHTQKSIRVDQLNIPKHIKDADDRKIMTDVYVDEKTFRRINRFMFYMDSLKTNERAKYDSIILGRPKLMDSITALEQLYYLQTQNKKYGK